MQAKKLLIVISFIAFNLNAAQDKFYKGFYGGFGVSQLNINPTNNTQSGSMLTALATIGYQISPIFSIEGSTTLGNSSDGVYNLDGVKSLGVIAEYELNNNFSLLGKLSVNAVKFSNSYGTTDVSNYGVGAGIRYKYNETMFFDVVYSSLLGVEYGTASNAGLTQSHKENINQFTAAVKESF